MTRDKGTRTIFLATLGLVLLTACGCANFDWRRPLPWQSAKSEVKMPTKLVAVWNETVKYTAGQQAMRGFGGRIMFYDEQNADSVLVDGTLVVYGFDEANRAKSDAKPDRKFVFPAQLLEKHYSEAKLGASYSFWLPWDKVGGERKDIALIVRFQPQQGSVVVGPQTNNLLSGRTPVAKLDKQGIQERFAQFAASNNQQDPPAADQSVRPVAFDQQFGINRPAQAPGTRRAAMSTTTISLPPGYRGMKGGGTPSASRQAAPRIASSYGAVTNATTAAAGVPSKYLPQPAVAPPEARSAHAQLPARAQLSSPPQAGRNSWQQIPARQSLHSPNIPPRPTSRL